MGIVERAGLFSVAVNVLLVVLKVSLAATSGSLTLAADAVHSLVDVLGSAVVLVGVLLAGRKASDFPYGLYKVENLVSVAIAVLIGLAGCEIAREALFAPSRDLANQPLALAGTALAAIVAYAVSWRQKSSAQSTGSPSLRADSQHFRVDALSSVVVFAAILGDTLGLPLDRLGAGAIVLFIAYASWGLLLDGSRVLLDVSLDAGTLAEVRRVALAESAVVEVRTLAGRNSGRYKFVEMAVALRTGDFAQAHSAVERIERALRASIPFLDRVLIHAEPWTKNTWRVALPLADPAGRVSAHFAQAPWFSLVEVRPATGEVLSREVLANPFLRTDKKKGIRVAEFLVTQGIDALALREEIHGRGPGYVLAAARVQVTACTCEDETTALAEGLRQVETAALSQTAAA